MTVQNSSNVASFNGSGSAGPFVFGFRFNVNTELQVSKTNVAGAVVPLYLDFDFTAVGAGSDDGGSLTLTTPLLNGESLVVRRWVDILQPVAFGNQGDFFPS